MWRLVGVFILGGVFGIGGGIGVGFFLFPFVFPPPPANESLSTEELTAVIAKGQFIHANTMDPVHYGSGGVTVLQRTVFLGSDFEVGPGRAALYNEDPGTTILPENRYLTAR